MKNLGTLLFVFTCALLHAQQKSSLAGSYSVNKTKTDFAGVPAWTLPAALKLTDEKGNVTIIRHIIDQTGTESDRTITFKDGKAIYSSPNGTQNKATLQWNADHSTLVFDNTSVDQSGNPGLAFKETWSLEDGGKTLVIDRHVEQPDGRKYDLKVYYDRQLQ